MERIKTIVANGRSYGVGAADPEAKTQEMFLPVGMDENGKLWSQPKAKLTDWDQVQKAVRAGNVGEFIEIGDEFEITVGNAYGSGTQSAILTVLGIDRDTPADSRYTHSLTLQFKECFYDTVFWNERDPDTGAYPFTEWAESDIRRRLNDPEGDFLTKVMGVSGILPYVGKVKKDYLKEYTEVLSGWYTEQSDDLFFLLSGTEVYGVSHAVSGEDGQPLYEGSAYPFYRDFSDHRSPSDAADENRIKFSIGSAKYQWLRTVNTEKRGVSGIYSDGRLSNTFGLQYTHNIAPAFCIV